MAALALCTFHVGQTRPMIRPQEPTQTDPNNPNKKGKNKKLKRGEGGDSIHPCPTFVVGKVGGWVPTSCRPANLAHHALSWVE